LVEAFLTPEWPLSSLCKLPEQGSGRKKIKKFSAIFVRNVFLCILGYCPLDPLATSMRRYVISVCQPAVNLDNLSILIAACIKQRNKITS